MKSYISYISHHFSIHRFSIFFNWRVSYISHHNCHDFSMIFPWFPQHQHRYWHPEIMDRSEGSRSAAAHGTLWPWWGDTGGLRWSTKMMYEHSMNMDIFIYI
jgi:hypothetical protein